MKARIVTGRPPGGERVLLAQKLPLTTPLLIQFFPIYACNFRCFYCTFSSDVADRGFISDVVKMDFDLFSKCIEEIACFPQKVKVIRFVGMGEPLLHDRIADMVAYTVTAGVTERVEILTNGSMLTTELADALIEAGLHRLLVSIQGTSSEKYREVCGVALDFERFVDNLRYYYERTQGQVHIKIIDCALENERDQVRFYALFGDVCDTIGIELAGPIFPNVDYQRVLPGKTKDLTQFGRPRDHVMVCPQPFFTMQINPDGKVVPCYSVVYPQILGDCNQERLTEIWDGKKWHSFRLRMLQGIEHAGEICSSCNIIRHRFHPEDDLCGVVGSLTANYHRRLRNS
jgi:radical SAM protein with 4Fe4S-binding SPASM domain